MKEQLTLLYYKTLSPCPHQNSQKSLLYTIGVCVCVLLANKYGKGDRIATPLIRLCYLSLWLSTLETYGSADFDEVNFPVVKQPNGKGKLGASSSQELPSANSWQENRNLSPIAASNQIIPMTTWAWERTLSFRRECRPTHILTEVWWNPEQKTQLSCTWPTETKKINVCYFKLLNLWQFVMQHRKLIQTMPLLFNGRNLKFELGYFKSKEGYRGSYVFTDPSCLF